MKIIFICLGNICRSTMAEYIFKSIDKENKFIVSSAGISNEEYGNDIYYKAKRTLEKNNIPYDTHFAHKITQEEFNNSDLIICVEKYQVKEIERLFDINNKTITLNDKDVEDPWYTNNFDKVYDEIYEGCLNLYNKLNSRE